MKNSKMIIGNKVAKSSNKYNTEFFTGTIKDLRNKKALVNFSDRGVSRWCNLSNLELLN